MPEGIPTEIDGFRCRSRLEATWAAMFDLLGWDYDYEPFDLPGWIPDFILKGALPVLVEVKPIVTMDEALEYAPKIAAAEPPYPVALVGCGPMPEIHYNALGTIIFLPGWSEETGDGGIYCGPGDYLHAMDCPTCRPQGGWGTPLGCFTCGKCGYHDGGSGAGRPHIHDLWAQAKNRVQWRAR
jgi:hypothetical protein